MDIAQKFKMEKEITTGFKVKGISQRPMMSDIANPIINFTEIRLDCLYENVAFLHYATFKEKPPPSEQWIQFSLSGQESISQIWKPQSIKQTCVGIDYRKRNEPGYIAAVTHLITSKSNVLISAQLMWFGFPLLNRIFVGFKPGMRERTEELLLAGLKLT